MSRRSSGLRRRRCRVRPHSTRLAGPGHRLSGRHRRTGPRRGGRCQSATARVRAVSPRRWSHRRRRRRTPSGLARGATAFAARAGIRPPYVPSSSSTTRTCSCEWWHRRLDRPVLRALIHLAPRPVGVVRRDLVGRDCPSAEPAAVGAGRITFVHADVTAHPPQVPRGWYDAETLSNVLGGPRPETAAALRAALRHAVRPGGPVVLRSFGRI